MAQGTTADHKRLLRRVLEEVYENGDLGEGDKVVQLVTLSGTHTGRQIGLTPPPE